MIVADLEEKRNELDKAMEYITLYGKYVECEAIYDVSNLLQLWDSLDNSDRSAFPFDPRIIDWRRYVYDIHLPTVVTQGRVKQPHHLPHLIHEEIDCASKFLTLLGN